MCSRAVSHCWGDTIEGVFIARFPPFRFAGGEMSSGTTVISVDPPTTSECFHPDRVMRARRKGPWSGAVGFGFNATRVHLGDEGLDVIDIDRDHRSTSPVRSSTTCTQPPSSSRHSAASFIGRSSALLPKSRNGTRPMNVFFTENASGWLPMLPTQLVPVCQTPHSSRRRARRATRRRQTVLG